MRGFSPTHALSISLSLSRSSPLLLRVRRLKRPETLDERSSSAIPKLRRTLPAAFSLVSPPIVLSCLFLFTLLRIFASRFATTIFTVADDFRSFFRFLFFLFSFFFFFTFQA